LRPGRRPVITGHAAAEWAGPGSSRTRATKSCVLPGTHLTEERRPPPVRRCSAARGCPSGLLVKVRMQRRHRTRGTAPPAAGSACVLAPVRSGPGDRAGHGRQPAPPTRAAKASHLTETRAGPARTARRRALRQTLTISRALHLSRTKTVRTIQVIGPSVSTRTGSPTRATRRPGAAQVRQIRPTRHGHRTLGRRSRPPIRVGRRQRSHGWPIYGHSSAAVGKRGYIVSRW